MQLPLHIQHVEPMTPRSAVTVILISLIVQANCQIVQNNVEAHLGEACTRGIPHNGRGTVISHQDILLDQRLTSLQK